MKWSWKIIRIAGIDVYLHATFLILIAWIGLSYWQLEGTLAAVINGVGFILALFLCVVLHEFGHALTARRYGIRTRHITLLPIGGIAMLERMPKDPKQEAIVALAGPAVNVAIAVALWFWLVLTNTPEQATQIGFAEGSFLERLLTINIMLAVFNLLPAFPMDGGRILRAVLAMNMGQNQATQTAAKVGQALALFLGFIGIMYNPFLIFIALFIWIGAAAEASSSQVKSALSGIALRKAMLTDFQVLDPNEPLTRGIVLTLAGSQKEFPVLENNIVVGVLTQTDLLQGLQSQGERALIGDWMHQQVESADIDEQLETVLERLQHCECRLLSVLDKRQLVGIINLDNIIELIRIQAALDERHHQQHQHR